MSLHLRPVPPDKSQDARTAVMSLLATMRQAAKAHHITDYDRASDSLHTLAMAFMQPRIADFGTELNLTKHQARLFGLLKANLNKIVSRNAVLNALYFDKPDDEPEAKIVDIFVCHIRKKLKASKAPLTIETIWGHGYRMKAI